MKKISEMWTKLDENEKKKWKDEYNIDLQVLLFFLLK